MTLTTEHRGVLRASALAFAALLLLAGCRQEMYDQPRTKPHRPSDFFADGRSDRQPVAGAIARGQLRDDPHLFTGKVGGQLVSTFPFPVTREVLERGRERFNIYCAPCHDRLGNGNGMIVRRGFRPPPSLHEDRLRDAPVGHHFDVISNGLGSMPDHAAQIPVRDRWAIVAYLRALQLSQRATVADVPPAALRELQDEAK